MHGFVVCSTENRLGLAGQWPCSESVDHKGDFWSSGHILTRAVRFVPIFRDLASLADD